VTAFYAKNNMEPIITLWGKCSVQVFKYVERMIKLPRIKGETTEYIRPNTYTNQEWNHKLHRRYLPLNKTVKIETKEPNIHNQVAEWK